jgi:NaMN:DMB phosphoribosyltransferase
MWLACWPWYTTAHIAAAAAAIIKAQDANMPVLVDSCTYCAAAAAAAVCSHYFLADYQG